VDVHELAVHPEVPAAPGCRLPVLQCSSAINGAESLDANRKREVLNAANVDKIMQMQKKQFLAQASYLPFDQETQSSFKIKIPAGQADQETQALATEAGVQIETINFIKLPPGLYGLKALQLALHELVCTMGKANYSGTTSVVSITSETCGTDLLKRLNDTISPNSGDTTKQAKNKYTTHKDSFHDDTDPASLTGARRQSILHPYTCKYIRPFISMRRTQATFSWQRNIFQLHTSVR
jgi:hypothetical protein